MNYETIISDNKAAHEASIKQANKAFLDEQFVVTDEIAESLGLSRNSDTVITVKHPSKSFVVFDRPDDRFHSHGLVFGVCGTVRNGGQHFDGTVYQNYFPRLGQAVEFAARANEKIFGTSGVAYFDAANCLNLKQTF